jgi:hypothetical protein
MPSPDVCFKCERGKPLLPRERVSICTQGADLEAANSSLAGRKSRKARSNTCEFTRIKKNRHYRTNVIFHRCGVGLLAYYVILSMYFLPFPLHDHARIH